jgi:hypothetical protein
MEVVVAYRVYNFFDSIEFLAMNIVEQHIYFRRKLDKMMNT